MLFSKKERAVEEMVISHLRVIGKVLQEFQRMINDYLDRSGLEDKIFKEEAYTIHKMEHEADIVRREILLRLSQGAFLPIHREDYGKLVEIVDKIANTAEAVADLIVLTRPRIPEFLVDDFNRIAKATVETFEPMNQIIETFQKDLNKVKDVTQAVNKKEEEVDQILWDMTKKLFKSDLDLAEKLHLKEVIESIADISDRIEDAADRFQLMVIKRKL